MRAVLRCVRTAQRKLTGADSLLLEKVSKARQVEPARHYPNRDAQQRARREITTPDKTKPGASSAPT